MAILTCLNKFRFLKCVMYSCMWQSEEYFDNREFYFINRFDGVSALDVFRIIVPDVVVIAVSITCVVCCRGLVDSSSLHSTTPQRIRITSDSSSWDNVMPYFIAVMLLSGGIMLPSLASAIYFLMFLLLRTMWACHKAVRLHKKAFASVRIALMVYPGVHVLTF